MAFGFVCFLGSCKYRVLLRKLNEVESEVLDWFIKSRMPFTKPSFRCITAADTFAEIEVVRILSSSSGVYRILAKE